MKPAALVLAGLFGTSFAKPWEPPAVGLAQVSADGQFMNCFGVLFCKVSSALFNARLGLVKARFSPALLHRASASAFNKQQHLITRMVNHNVIISTHPSPGRYIHTYVRFSSIPVEGTYIHRVLADVGVHTCGLDHNPAR